ncbi:MAG: RAMP superfamily CRISPR-associated protein [Bryobacteraceae bacterium]
MSNLSITIHWKVDAPLHIGTGLSQSGGADRTIRVNPATGQPEFPGDAFKGAVRGLAERLVRWLDNNPKPEPKLHSLPQYEILRHIFACSPDAAAYRFTTPTDLTGGEITSHTGTAINPDTGSAKDHTLRITQSWTAGARFKAVITAANGDWSRDGQDYLDLVLLYAALVATDAAGGRKSNGHGQLEIEKVEIDGAAKEELLSPANLATLQQRIRADKGDYLDA